MSKPWSKHMLYELCTLHSLVATMIAQACDVKEHAVCCPTNVMTCIIVLAMLVCVCLTKIWLNLILEAMLEHLLKLVFRILAQVVLKSVQVMAQQITKSIAQALGSTNCVGPCCQLSLIKSHPRQWQSRHSTRQQMNSTWQQDEINQPTSNKTISTSQPATRHSNQLKFL